jgi:hypothetical protein
MLSCSFILLFLITIEITASRMICSNKKQVKNALRHVLEDGGEGVILRLPLSLYLPGRSDALVKLKVFSLTPLSTPSLYSLSPSISLSFISYQLEMQKLLLWQFVTQIM